MNAVNEITEKLFQEYGNRKRPNRIDFIVNVDTGLHYPIPRDVEHADFVPTLHFPKPKVIIPYWMTLLKIDDKVMLEQLVFGASSFEAVYNVSHTPEHISRGRDLAWELILRSPYIDYSTIERDETFKTFIDYTKEP